MDYHSFDHRDINFSEQLLSRSPPLSSRICGCLANELSLFSDTSGSWRQIFRGGIYLLTLGTLFGLLAPKDDELRGPWYPTLSSIVGYTYFLAWSISFYPQVFSNFRRKSTEGLSVDFVVLNLLGFACYSVFNLVSFYRESREEGARSVQSNDVLFASHAFLLTAVTLGQVFLYDGFAWKELWGITRLVLFFSAVSVGAYVSLVVAFGGDGEEQSWLDWISFLYFLSSVKVFISIGKYAPQVVLNVKRRSTEGWSVWNVLLDFAGGVLSIAQLVGDCANMGNFSVLAENPAKFALGFVSIAFDMVFMCQHYLLYSNGHRIEYPIRDDFEAVLGFESQEIM